MLSELQHFCLDAMGLSHGLVPKKLSANVSLVTDESKPTIKQASAPQINAPQSIQRLMPKIEIPGSIEKVKKVEHSENTALAPKDIKNLSDWSILQSAVKECQYCKELASTRSQTILGLGNEHAELMIISEAPSSDEDIQGYPFVGKAGELLDNMLLAIGIKRESTYITNIIKCLPPNNRDPHKDESQACNPFLRAQIDHIKPKLILALGRIAAHNLLNVKTPVGQLRGEIHQHPDSKIDLIISYHPAYLLRNPTKKADSWEDLKQVHQLLSQHD